MENLSREGLYDKAQEFKEKEDWNNYFIYMTMSANLEYKPAIYDLIRSEFKKQDCTKTLEFYEKTKEYGYSKAILGFIYGIGIGVEKNIELAINYYKQAIEMGNSMAMVSLAYRHRFSNMGVEKDEEKVIDLYNKAIESENPGAFHGLACYYRAQGDLEKTVEYFELAIKHFYPLSRDNLILTYQNYPNAKDEKYIINYFLDIDDSEALTKIYNYTDNIISILKEKRDLEKEIQVLRKENREMRNHIESSPDGILYFEALAEWKAKVQ